MISGGGRTLLNLAAAISDRRLPAARITGVVTSTPPGSVGYERAKGLGVPVVHLPGHPTAAAFEETVMTMGADMVVLAGYLKRIDVPASLAGRIVNIHPALLPDFGGKGMYGHHVHEAVLKLGAKVSGCTVHLVDNEYDHGAVVLQRSCAVLPGDTPEMLAARVFEEEKLAYVEALGLLVAGKFKAEANR